MSASLSHCPPQEQLRGFALGTIDEAEASRIADHLDQCAACEQTVDSLDLADDTIVSAILSPPALDPYADEPGCRRVVALALEIGAELTSSPAANQAAAPGTSPPPEQIGPYRILERIGAGGMGAVYKAVHTRLDRIVALKVLPAERTQNASAVSRFEREMRAIGQLDHPHIVRATDAGEAAGAHFLAMELVDGLDLATIVRRHGPLPVPAACEVVRQAALGLQEAHRHGMVHRDIKPSNLMLARSPRPGEPPAVKVLDLGLALLSDDRARSRDEITSRQQVVGTVDYLPPEQLSDTHHVDIRADIYSLGATLYKLLTGDVPFATSRYPTLLAKLSAIASDPIPPVETQRADVPAELAVIVARMLSRDPAHRFATPQDVATALSPFCSGHRLAQLYAGQELDGRPTTEITAALSRAPLAGASSIARRRHPLIRWALLSVVPIALCAAIIITIKRPDGTETVIELPPQTDVTITHDGAADSPRVEIRPAATAAAEVEANRRAVAWSLAVGGKVTLLRGEQRFPVNSPLVLPSTGDLLDISLTQLRIVDDEAIENLRGATAIRTLVINSTSVSRLDVLTSLTDLESLNCSIDVVDADDLRTLIPLASLRELAVGNLASIPPDPEATAAAFEVACRFPQLRSLKFGSFYYHLDDASLAHLQQMPQLETLGLGSADLTNEGLLQLPQLPELSWLALGCPQVSGRGLARMSEYPKLKSLTIRSSRMTGEDLQHVVAPPSLEELWFYDCSELTGTGLGTLACLPQLSRLVFVASGVTDDGLASAASAGHRLQTLGLVNSPHITSAGLESLVQLPQLQWLDLSGCAQITDDAVSILARMPALTFIQIPRTGISPNGVAALKMAKPDATIVTE